MGDGLDVRAWLTWVMAAALVAMLVQNPLYSLVLLLVSVVVGSVCGRRQDTMDLPLFRVGVVVLLFTAAFHASFVHTGDTILFSIPDAWPLVGGPITLESVVAGASTGLILLALLALFSTFNRVTSASELVRLVPPGLHDLGVVVLIALTYIPETTRHLERIREAQAVRGHRIQGLRDWRPIAIPLLVGGLERAMSLAEAMVARGYGSSESMPRGARSSVATLVGLFLALGGWLLALWRGWLGAVPIAVGIALLGGVIWRGRSRAGQTRYRPRRWQRHDTLVVLLALAAVVVIVFPWSGEISRSLHYSPYPRFEFPPFSPVVGLALLAFLAPALVASVQPMKSTDRGYQ